MNGRKEKITIENYRRTTVSLRRGGKIGWCEQCGAKTAMLSPDAAAAVLQTTAREVFRLTEAGEIHFLETEAGALLVCRKSLGNFLTKKE